MSARPRRTWPALVLAFVLLGALAVAFVHVYLVHRERERTRGEQAERLTALARDLSIIWTFQRANPPLARGDLGDPTGQRALGSSIQGVTVNDRSDAFYALQAGAPLRDLWEHDLVYRCPGPVHRHGWDLSSYGPDGIDDEGQGDDVLVGADLAPVASAAH